MALKSRNHAHPSWRLAASAALLTLLLAVVAPLAAAEPIPLPTFADPAFERTWERYDRPVYYGQASRSYTWGAAIGAEIKEEPYKEGPGGKHKVQYFEKSRMEINNPSGDQSNPFYVTQGLLARDMIRGEIQEGDTLFRKVSPAQIPFGDPDDLTGPTYASLNGVLDAPAIESGKPITAAIDRAGNVSNTADSRGVTSMGVVPGGTNHSIASVFYNYLTQSGVVYENGQNVTEALYAPTFYVTGLPITEAYWTLLKADNQSKTVLVQCFERRCLTYTPANPAAFQVEQANTGLQYYTWRYPKQPSDTQAPLLTNITAGETTATSVTISWKTNEPATSEIRYGVTDQYDKLQGDFNLKQDHAVTLTGLLPNQNYHFAVSSVDAAGNRATSADIVFKTKPQTQAPVVSNVQVAVTKTTATITFTTNQAATAQVIYYTDPTTKTTVSTTDTAATSHTITLSNLTAGTKYTYQIVASSADGQTTTPEATFTTSAP